MAYRNLTAGQVDVSVEVAVLRGKVGYGAAYLAVGDVGVVRMSFGEDKPGLAGVGAEELWDEGGFVGTFGGFLYVVFGDLDGFATAVPAVGWIIGAPERVVDALGDTVEGAVLVADAFVSGGLVAEGMGRGSFAPGTAASGRTGWRWRCRCRTRFAAMPD